MAGLRGPRCGDRVDGIRFAGPAAELALTHGASACTDITGFGLLGHLLEMLGTDLGACLDLGATFVATGIDVTLLAGALRKAAKDAKARREG